MARRSLSRLLAQTVPLALAAAISPVLFLLQLRALAGARPVASGAALVAGAAVPLGVLSLVVLAIGSSISLSESPTTKAVLDLLLGLVLVALGLRAALSPRERPPQPPRASAPRAGLGGSFAVGVGGMTTNVTTIALFVPALKLVSASRVDAADKLVVVVLLVCLVLSSIALPVVLTALAPGAAGRLLGALADLLRRHSRHTTIVLGLGFGAWLVVKGIAAL